MGCRECVGNREPQRGDELRLEPGPLAQPPAVARRWVGERHDVAREEAPVVAHDFADGAPPLVGHVVRDRVGSHE